MCLRKEAFCGMRSVSDLYCGSLRQRAHLLLLLEHLQALVFNTLVCKSVVLE